MQIDVGTRLELSSAASDLDLDFPRRFLLTAGVVPQSILRSQDVRYRSNCPLQTTLIRREKSLGSRFLCQPVENPERIIDVHSADQLHGGLSALKSLVLLGIEISHDE